MRSNPVSKGISVLILTSFVFSSSGCSTLKPGEYERYGYHGTVEVKEGKRIVPLDIVGNILGALEKLILWNWKIERHWIKEDTKAAIDDYIKTEGDKVGDLSIQLNRYNPADAWRRLRANKGVAAPYKYTLGILAFVFSDVILVGRVFGGDHYNPFSHTVYLYSDLPTVALHEIGHAQDFARRRHRGSYALLYMLPFAPLYHEWQATQNAFDHIRAEKDTKMEIQAYKVLYPAYGTYAGGATFLPYGTVLGAIIGHIWGRSEAKPLETKLALQT